MRKIAQFGIVKVYRDVEWNQYIVKDCDDEAKWYYTSDKQDALDTAQRTADYLEVINRASTKPDYKELVDYAINTNHTVSVFDGEEWPVKKSHRYFDVINAIESVEEARVVIRDQSGNQVFWALIIPFGVDPDETIADCSDNAFLKSFESRFEV